MAYLTVSTANGICADCWCFFSRKRSTKKRCNECMLARSRAKHRGYAEKIRRANGTPLLGIEITCQTCPNVFQRTGGNDRFCTDCRRQRLVKEIGSVIKCAVCSVEITKNSGPHVNCKACTADLKRLRKVEINKLTDHAAVYQRVKEKVKAHQTSPAGRAVRNAANAKRRSDPKEQLRDRMSGLIRNSLKGKGGRSWETMVDYTKEDLILHIERQFLPGMSWESFGPNIHIDHILPVSSFQFETPDDPEFKACWALTNLRPLWAVDNIKKSDKVLYLV